MSDFDDLIANEIPAEIYMFAGAGDSEQSTEVSNVKTFQLPDPAGKAGGACTSALLQTLYRDDAADTLRYTWAETLEMMREKIEEIGLNQQPQLSSSRPIDVNQELHIVPPDCQGTKRALLVGINYVGEANALTGCQKDTRNVKEFLMDICGFHRENMLILMDDGKHHEPTKKMIEDGLTRLAEISEPGDCIFFQFSGHGGQLADKDGKFPYLWIMDGSMRFRKNSRLTDGTGKNNE
jgi:metacaspase-1